VQVNSVGPHWSPRGERDKYMFPNRNEHQAIGVPHILSEKARPRHSGENASGSRGRWRQEHCSSHWTCGFLLLTTCAVGDQGEFCGTSLLIGVSCLSLTAEPMCKNPRPSLRSRLGNGRGTPPSATFAIKPAVSANRHYRERFSVIAPRIRQVIRVPRLPKHDWPRQQRRSRWWRCIGLRYGAKGRSGRRLL
jgi:hypothetical protein